MTDKLVTARPEDGSRTIFFRMREHDIRHMPVVDADGKLAGIISDGDLMTWLEQGSPTCLCE